MKIIGCHKTKNGAYTFFCISKSGWKCEMTVSNIVGAEDMSYRVAEMTWEQYNALPDRMEGVEA